MTTDTILAWHFTGDTMRDGRPIPPVGEWLDYDGVRGPLKLCDAGLHASDDVLDALQYAPGHTLHRVELSGEIIRDTDKLCASRRRIIASVNAEPLLRAFARWCALQVAHLWNCPEVVQLYLATGDESIRAAAWAAASAAAWDAASGAAWDAARDAAWAATRAAASAATSAAAWAAASAAARDAAWGAACADARDAASGAARGAASAAARDAARAATSAAAWAAQRAELLRLVTVAMEESHDH